MTIALLAALVGFMAGLRTFTPPAVIAWSANLGLLDLQDSWIAPLANPWAAGVLTVFAIAELVGDKLPRTPARTHPAGFGARLISGAFCGAALGLATGSWWVGVILGVVGAGVGTFLGYRARMAVAGAFGRDWPAALIEDLIALAGAVAVIAVALPA